MNLFILCTGRCGSTTFIQACSHISNYSSAHESRTSKLGPDRFAYPKQHIEADNRLSWLLGRLNRIYGDQAHYVHLKRDTLKTAESYVKRYDGGIMKAYRGNGILMGISQDADPLSVAIDYCNTVNTNIDLFLRDKSNVMRIDLQKVKEAFPIFCNWIGAEVNMEKAIATLNMRHNKTRVTPPF